MNITAADAGYMASPDHRRMNRPADYFERQLARCDEALALCDRSPTPQQLADAEAALAVSAPAPQAELNLTSP